MSRHVSLARCRMSPDGIHSWANCAAERCLNCGETRWAITKRLHRMRRSFAQFGHFGNPA